MSTGAVSGNLEQAPPTDGRIVTFALHPTSNLNAGPRVHSPLATPSPITLLDTSTPNFSVSFHLFFLNLKVSMVLYVLTRFHDLSIHEIHSKPNVEFLKRMGDHLKISVLFRLNPEALTFEGFHLIAACCSHNPNRNNPNHQA